MSFYKDIIGRRFTRLIAIRRLVGSRIECVCDCGRKTTQYTADLIAERVKSCGCLGAQSRYTHGLSHTPEYGTWEHMIQRCENPKNSSYKDYGARGIKVCERWRNSFPNFYADVGPRPFPHYTIERIDNDKDYEPGNCKWITKGAQSQNTRALRMLTFNGETLPTFKWAQRLGMSENTIRTRLHRGWSPEQALTLKAHRGQRIPKG